MPVYEPKSDGPKWPLYVGCGLGGLILLAVIAVVGVHIWMSRMAASVISQAMSPTPIVRTKPYRFGYAASAAKVSIPLPDGHTLTYMHDFGDPKLHTGGERALRMGIGGGSLQEWPLQYWQSPNIRVGVYWYGPKNGQGPLVRLLDASVESILDLRRMEVGELVRDKGNTYMCDYAYNDSEWASGYPESSGPGTPVRYYSANGSPALDMTIVTTPSNCRYLGSIVRKGNRLIFVPNKGSRKP